MLGRPLEILVALVASAAIASACSGGDGRSDNTPRSVLLQASGSGTQTTATFTAAGHWSIAWSFDCGAGSGGSFFVDVYNASDHTPDFKNRGIDAEGEQHAADTSQFTNPGKFYLEITTTCAWAIKVFE